MQQICPIVSLCEMALAVFCVSRWRQWPDRWQRPTASPPPSIPPWGSCSLNSILMVCVALPDPTHLTNVTSAVHHPQFSPVQAAPSTNAVSGPSHDVRWKDVKIWRVVFCFLFFLLRRSHRSAARVVYKLYKPPSAAWSSMSSALPAINGRLGGSRAECVNEIWGVAH